MRIQLTLATLMPQLIQTRWKFDHPISLVLIFGNKFPVWRPWFRLPSLITYCGMVIALIRMVSFQFFNGINYTLLYGNLILIIIMVSS